MLNDLTKEPVPVPIGSGVGPRPGAPSRPDLCPIMVQFAVWFVLVAVAVLGRLWQPGWNVTPMAGVALAAGVLFRRPLVAAGVPLTALAVSNLAMPSSGSAAMAAVVYAATAWPVLLGGGLLGRGLRGSPGAAAGVVERAGRVLPIVGCALASSLVFYLSTNFAHWCLTNDYPRTIAGLVSCYVAALPFYRWMPVGDVAWSLAIFGGLSAVERLSRGHVPTVSRTA